MVSEDEVIQSLKKVMDPHTNMNVYDMGLIKDLSVKDGNVSLTFIPSSPYCPLGTQLAFAIKEKIKEIKGIENVDIKVEGYVQEKQLNELLKKK